MKKTRKMMMVLLTVSMMAMLLSGCKKNNLIVDESKESSTQATVELPTITKEPINTKEPEESKEVEVTSEPTKAPEPTEEAVATPEVTKEPEVTEAPTAPPAPGHTHDYGSGVVTTQATCGATGVKTYTCSCGDTKTETIPATGNHVNTYEDYMHYPSCTRGGYVNVVCSDCGTWISGGDVGALPHEYETILSYAGDCITPAHYRNICKNCGFPGEPTLGEVNPDVHNNIRTVTDEVWDDEKKQWMYVTGSYCGDCGKDFGTSKIEYK